MSPTTIFLLAASPYPPLTAGTVGRGVPGVGGDRVGTGRGYTGSLPDPPRYPYLVIFSLKGPTYGRMKAILRYSMRFPKIDLRIDPESTQN